MSNNYKWFFDRYHEDIKSLCLDVLRYETYFSKVDSELNIEQFLNRMLIELGSIISKNHDWRDKEYREFHDEYIKIRESKTEEELFEIGKKLSFVNDINNIKLKKKESK